LPLFFFIMTGITQVRIFIKKQGQFRELPFLIVI
jgi:hypothetical protein